MAHRLILAFGLLLLLAATACAPLCYQAYDGAPEARGPGFGVATEFQPRRQVGAMNPGTWILHLPATIPWSIA